MTYRDRVQQIGLRALVALAILSGFGVLVGFALWTPGCGGNPGPASVQETAEALMRECHAFCDRRFVCFQAVCNEDYPGSAPTLGVTIKMNECIHTYCDSGAYAADLPTQGRYVECVAQTSCRELVTGSCGDAPAQCLAGDPSSTPWLPGFKAKALAR